METITNIDKIKICCKTCGGEMILESSLNINLAVFVCEKCELQIRIGIL